MINGQGIEKIIETKISEVEHAKMINSADKMQEVLDGIELWFLKISF